MKTRTLLLFVLSVAFGLAAAWMANNWLNSQQSGTRAMSGQNVETTQVVVAAADLIPGAQIDPLHIQLKEIDSRLVPPGALTKLEEAHGMVAKNNLYRGDVLRRERLAQLGEGSTLSVLLDPGMRAVTVRVNDVIGVAGFLLPGNRVDILYTEGDSKQTQTVLKNLKVLAVDQTQHTDENRPKLVRAVTLEVSPDQAEKLVNASSNGYIQLALRNPADLEDLELAKPEPAVVATSDPVPQPPTQPATRPAPRPSTIDVIKGTNQEQVQVKS